VRFPEIELALASQYALPVVLILGLLVYMFLRDIVVRAHHIWEHVRIKKKAGRLRNEQPRPKSTVARKTDQFAQLSPKAKKIHRIAEQLLEQKKYKESALLFESINFQRRAIDILEQQGFIEEAASMLLKLGVPYRAAILYQRNGKLEKAANLYLSSSHKQEAGQVFMKLAERDYHYFKPAAQCFIEAGLTEDALKACRHVLMTDEIIKLSFASQKFEVLCQYMMMPYNAMSILPKLSDQQVQSMIDDLVLTPQITQCLAMWIQYRADPIFVTVCLGKVRAHTATARLFWTILSSPFVTQLCHLFAAQPQLLTGEEYRFHGDILRQIDKQQHGDYLIQLIPYGRSAETMNTAMPQSADNQREWKSAQ
jgi:tetratricopeptide (TPR) repeat protein